VRRLVLTHFSQRHADTGRYLDEAGEVFAGDFVVAEVLAQVPVPRRS
jgi:ribonuclease Z